MKNQLCRSSSQSCYSSFRLRAEHRKSALLSKMPFATVTVGFSVAGILAKRHRRAVASKVRTHAATCTARTAATSAIAQVQAACRR